MNIKPKIGILFLTSGWFRKVGLQTYESNLTEEIERAAKETVERLSRFIDPVFSGIIFSEEEARKSAQEINSAKVDGLLISSLMWCEDQILRAALKELPRLPMIIWAFSPLSIVPDFLPFQQVLKGTGTVGALQMSGFLKREGYKYQTVAGFYRDEEVYRKIENHCLAFSISKKLQSVKVGVLPFRCDQMSTTYVDEFKLRAVYGVELKHLELEYFKKAAQSLVKEEIEQFKLKLMNDGQKIEVDEKNLNEGIKYALAMEKIISEEGLNILAMNDVCDEMHNSLGLRPCLCNPKLSNAGVVVSMEAEIAAGVSMYILRLYTGESPFYTEPLCPNYENNCLLMGHAGYHDIINRDKNYPVKIVPDVEYENSDRLTGAVTFFKYKPGSVTGINSVFDGERLKWVAFEGESLPGTPKMDGNCHLYCKLNPSLKDFYTKSIDSGVSQHWLIVPGHIAKELKNLCLCLNIDFMEID